MHEIQMQTAALPHFDHVAVPVLDPGAAYALFADVLNLPLLAAYSGDDWDGAPWLMMIFGLADDGQIALCAREGAVANAARATDLPHFAIRVRDSAQLQQVEQRLNAAGLATRREDHGDQHSIYFDDTSGLTWEITTTRSQMEIDADARRTIQDWIAQHAAASEPFMRPSHPSSP